MQLPRYLRLLPTVVAVGACLLAIKTTGLVHEAYAEAAEQVASLNGGLASDPKPSNEDYAGGEDDQISSASQVDVINALGKRRKELDAREGQLTIQANMIAAAEARVDTKITQLKTLQAQIAALLNQRDQAQKDQIAALVKTYKTMPPKKAAPIFQTLPDEVAIPVAQGMSAADLASILQFMTPDTAKALTVKLANKLALPQTADALAPVAAPAPAAAATPAPAPGPQAAAAPVAKAPATPEKAATPKT